MTAVPAALGDQPRIGTSAWYNSFNARRGVATSSTDGGSTANPNTAPNSPTGTAGGVAQSVANFAQAARTIAQAAQAQAAAQAASQSGSSVPVPEGLTPGGLWVNPASVAAHPTLWSGAALPTAAPSSGATGATGRTGGTTVTVKQTAATADLTWNTFNVGANTTLRFNQGASNWTVLNRVSDPAAAPSQILGTISAPGQVLVLNPNGILFGAGSQVNVGSLVASTANLAATQFSSILSTQSSGGAYLPVFTGATAPVTVQAGASITTNPPANPTDRGGFAMLLGQTVRNDGEIVTPNGQTILAAGRDFIIRNGFGSTGANGLYSTTEGLEVAPAGSGIATNTGLIQATTGDITLTAETVLQAGVLLSTTTVAQRGTIHLLTSTNDTASSVTFAPGSLTAIQPEDDGSTATDSARAASIAQSATANVARNGGALLSNQVALPDQQYQSRIEIVSGGTVEFQNGSLGLSTGGQIAISATGRVLADTGATLSVAGSVNTVLPATANTLSISAQGYDLRDAPANRDTGKLTSQTINIALGDLVQIGDLQYTSGGLLEVSGYVAGVGHSIGEWTSVGGSIAVRAGELVAQPGAQFNIAGGVVSYAAGQTPNTWLMASNGKLYNVNTAPSNLTYTGIYDGFTVTEPRWGVSETFNSPLIAPATSFSPGYSVGRDAGTLTIDAPTTVMEATIAAGVSTGPLQDMARPPADAVVAAYSAISSGSSTYFDPFTLALTVVPMPGTLVLGPVVLGNAAPAVRNTSVSITDAGAPLASSLGVSTPVPQDRVDTTWLAAAVLNNAGLGGLTVVTKGPIAVDAAVTLADGGIVSLLAPSVEVSGSVTARGGQVTVANYSPTYFKGQSTNFLDAASTIGTTLPSSVTLGSGGTIDTRGVFTNLSLDLASLAGEAFVNGGAVTIDTSGVVTLSAGSTIDASAGGAVLANRSAKGGTGGAISITAYDPSDTAAAAMSAPVTIAGTLRSLGSGNVPCATCIGGALTLAVPEVAIGAAGQPDAFTVGLPVAFFTSGFSSYTLSGQNGVTVAPGAQVVVVQPIQQFIPATALVAGGTDPAAAFTVGLPALYTPNTATAVMVQRSGASITLRAGTSRFATGGITIGTGSAISVDPLQSIGLEAQGSAAVAGTQSQIIIDGALIAPSGTINVVNDQFAGTSGSLSIWLGGSSVLNVSAQAATGFDRFGRVFGTVPSGGSIHVGGQLTSGQLTLDAEGNPESTNAFIVVRPGATISAAGASAALDPDAGQTLNPHGVGRPSSQPVLVASAGGSISFDSESGIFLGGQMTAPAGGAGAQGGTISIDLATPDYTDVRFGTSILVASLPAYNTVREIVVSAVATPSPGVTRPGDPFADSAFGQAVLSTGQIAAGGFDIVNLSSGDAILFDGSAALSAGRSITLTAAILGATATTGAASVSAPYVTLAGSGTATRSGLTFQRPSPVVIDAEPNWQPPARTGQGTLTVDAANIDVSGNLYFGVHGPITSLSCQTGNCPTVDLAAFATTTLSSSGDIRLLPSTDTKTTLTTPGNLTLVAGQIYPVRGTVALITAGLESDPVNGFTSNGTITIGSAPGAVPAAPLTAGGEVTFSAAKIAQGGVVRAPDGEIDLGYFGPTGYANNLNVATSSVVLLPGSITSVSMNGLTIPYGGTSDGTSYQVNGSAISTTAPFANPPLVTITAQSVQLQAGATIDLSGGGILAGAGFVPGRGGSNDITEAPLLGLTASGTVTAPPSNTNLVYAILPGLKGSVAPPPASAAAFTGPLPQAGEQITIAAGVPGLPAGTYTLLPGSDALLPGAYRVQLATTAHAVLAGTLNLGNGSYLTNGYRSVANTSIVAARSIQVTVTPGAAVRLDAQYNETDYASFALSRAALFDTPRTTLTLPADAKTLLFNFPATTAGTGLALQLQGTVLSSAGPGGLGGIVDIAAAAPIEVIANGTRPTSGTVSILGSDLSGLNADTLVIGSTLSPFGTGYQFGDALGGTSVSSPSALYVRDGASVSAGQVFLVSSNGGSITVERGATISTIGRPTPSVNSSAGQTFDSNGRGVLAVSNASVLFSAPTQGGSITIGTCGVSCGASATLFSTGTIATATTGDIFLDPTTRLGTAALSMSGSVINFGTPPSGTFGLTFTVNTLQDLLTGDAADGVPALRSLTLTANSAINLYGTLDLNTLDPATGQSTLQLLQFNSPAINGGPGVNTHVTTGSFIWNGVAGAGVSAAPGTRPADSESGPSALSIATDTIVLGYGPTDQAQNNVALNRLILGFDSVALTANQSISGNNNGSLAVYRNRLPNPVGTPLTGTGGDLTLATPLLTGAAGSVLTVTAGGNLTIATTGGAVGRAVGQGASLTLNAANISSNTSIVLPSGQLIMNATAGAISLGGSSQLNLAGVTTTLSDQSTDGWGGNVTLQAGAAGIMQAAGGTIDVSAGQANAGTITLIAPGAVSLLGAIRGSSAAGFTSGSFSVRAGGLGGADSSSGFAALNASLDAGGLFGGRSFELLTGDLAIGAGTTVRANTVSVSVDQGGLTVAGTLDASGAAPGTIRLSAGGNLTLAAGSVLDAHGSVPQLDSYLQSIDSENTGSVTLTSVSGTLVIAGPVAALAAPVINVSAPAGVTCGMAPCGQVTLNAPRVGETSGDIAIAVPVGVNIQGAGSVAVDAFQIYGQSSGSVQTVVQDNGTTLTPDSALPTTIAAGAIGLAQIDNNSTVFMNAAVPAGALNQGLATKLAGLMTQALAPVFHLRPGVEIDSPTQSASLTVGNATKTAGQVDKTDLDLSVFRYQSVAVSGRTPGLTEPGALVIRAGDGLTILGSINDGFNGAPTLDATTAPGGSTSNEFLRAFLELAQPLAPNPDGSAALSWSIRLVAGADLGAADSRIVLPSDRLAAAAPVPVPGSTTATDPAGSIELYDPHSQPVNSLIASTASTLLPGWSVIRTGTGDLDVLAGGSVDEGSTYAIYTAGASASLPAGSIYNLPRGTVATSSVLSITLKSTSTGIHTVPAGTVVSDGTTSFITTKSVTLRGNGISNSVQVVAQGSGFNDKAGTVLAVLCPASGCTFANVTFTATNGLSNTPTVLGSNGQATNNTSTFESLVGSYQAYYPQGGGNLLISAGSNITGYLPTIGYSSSLANTGSAEPMDGVGNWLWRQGEGVSGSSSGASTAWWINFGTLALPLDANGVTQTTVPTLTGFTGIGTLGGGNVTILAGGNIGGSATTSVLTVGAYKVTHAIDVAIGSTGRVSQGASDGSGIQQTGGGVLTIRAGGVFNGGESNAVGFQANGTLTDTRGSIDVLAGSIGQITLGPPGTLNYNATTTVGDPRVASPLIAYTFTGAQGPIVVPGDATVSLDARGDVVLYGVGDPTRLPEQNLTPANLTAGGAASGLTWFSLWQPGTAINLGSAGGNLVANAQAADTNAVGQENATAPDNRFLYPPTLTAIAASGSIYAGTAVSASGNTSSVELAPSPTGQLELFAAGSIYDDAVNRGQPQSFDVSGASIAAVPTALNAAFEAAGTTGSVTSSNAAPNIGAAAQALFAFGADTASGSLHAGDPTPALIYAGGDIVDMRYGETLCFACSSTINTIAPGTWYVSGKALRMVAGGDIVEPGTPYIAGQGSAAIGQLNPSVIGGVYTSTSGLIVNNNPGDVSVIQAGGEIIYANLAVAGPGQLYIQAGGTVYQGDRGVVESLGPLSGGVVSAGPARSGGSGITVVAGVGAQGPAWDAFAQTYLAPAMGYDPAVLSYLQSTYNYTGDASAAPGFFEALPVAQQRALLLQIYFDELRDSGREFTNPASDHHESYIRGRTAIATLFPVGSFANGDITLFGDSGIKTDFGGDIVLLSPGGATSLGNSTLPPAVPTRIGGLPTQGAATPGVLTQGVGNIGIFSRGSVILGESRVFTTFGGSIVIWSEEGDINAGNGIKSTQLVSTPSVSYDAFGRISLSPSIPTTGAGIATLAPIPGTPEGDLDLIAPLGVIDAGEAGIRVSGNANLAALTVVNAANIQVGGKSSGLPTFTAPNVSALTAASATAAAAAQTAQAAASSTGQNSQQQPSTITVDFLGFGDQ